MSFTPPNRGAAGSNIGPTSAGNVVPKGYRYGKISQYTPQQHDLFQSLFSNVMPGSYLERLASGSEEGFAPMERNANRDFQRYMGNLSSRFSRVGARRSSGFQNAATQGAQDFASQLAERRSEYQRTALRDLMEMSGQLLGQRPYEQFLTKKEPKQPSFLEKLGLSFGTGAGQFGSMYGAKQLGVF